MPQPALEIGLELRPFAQAQLNKELEDALRFHEERLRQSVDPEDDIAAVVRRRSEIAREEIIDALSRVSVGTYGICQMCQGPISEARLEAMPHTPHCVNCAHQVRRQGMTTTDYRRSAQ